MKKYMIVFGVLAFVSCNNSKNVDESAVIEKEVRQRTIDSMAAVHSNQQHSNSTSNTSTRENNTVNENNDKSTTQPAKKKGMSNTTKGALIGTGVGIGAGAATGAATSKDKGKGAVVGGIIGGAVGSGVGYGIGADKDKKAKNDTIQK